MPVVERCSFAMVDTIGLAKKLDERLFGKEMPVKVRISISGCPNACTSPMLNEIGIIGRESGEADPRALHRLRDLRRVLQGGRHLDHGVSVLDEERCVQCGVCIQSCPFHLLKSEHRHYLMTVGGRRGRHPKIGRELLALEEEEKVVEAVERIVRWVYRRAWSGRLLSSRLDDLTSRPSEQSPGTAGRTAGRVSAVMVQGREPLVPVVIALDGDPVPDEGVEHHGRVHQGLVRGFDARSSPPAWGVGYDPRPRPDTPAVHTVPAVLCTETSPWHSGPSSGPSSHRDAVQTFQSISGVIAPDLPI